VLFSFIDCVVLIVSASRLAGDLSAVHGKCHGMI
jgi:hypothetical protein